ncbi:hypothetical protein PHJA_001867700 [Phtheirospermum japonicum]|uniref:Uncharacterized protein n=1 Tax=Phtheirospermum japonicum TaxID=374723 RepID=A0A830CDH6_9LAMI|nr:hypothetical protein PHJA_001867700 [Phtheirospermum japonicum]
MAGGGDGFGDSKFMEAGCCGSSATWMVNGAANKNGKDMWIHAEQTDTNMSSGCRCCTNDNGKDRRIQAEHTCYKKEFEPELCTGCYCSTIRRVLDGAANKNGKDMRIHAEQTANDNGKDRRIQSEHTCYKKEFESELCTGCYCSSLSWFRAQEEDFGCKIRSQVE